MDLFFGILNCVIDIEINGDDDGLKWASGSLRDLKVFYSAKRGHR